MSIIEAPAPAETTTVTTRDVLSRAADLLEEFGWCQDAAARDAAGCSTMPQDRTAVSFCLTGACERALYDLLGINVRQRRAAPEWLALGPPLVGLGVTDRGPGWNNQDGRVVAEVVAVLRAAAERAS